MCQYDSSHINTDGELRFAWLCLKRAEWVGCKHQVAWPELVGIFLVEIWGGGIGVGGVTVTGIITAYGLKLDVEELGAETTGTLLWKHAGDPGSPPVHWDPKGFVGLRCPGWRILSWACWLPGTAGQVLWNTHQEERARLTLILDVSGSKIPRNYTAVEGPLWRKLRSCDYAAKLICLWNPPVSLSWEDWGALTFVIWFQPYKHPWRCYYVPFKELREWAYSFKLLA